MRYDELVAQHKAARTDFFPEDRRRRLAEQAASSKTKESKPNFWLSLVPFGEIARKKIKGEDVSTGEILTEGALSLVPFGLGRAAKAARTAYKVGKATKVGKGFAESYQAAKAAAKVAPAGKTATKAAVQGKIADYGKGLQADAAGLAPATKVGKKTLTNKQSAANLEYLKNITKAKKPANQLADLETHLERRGQEIASNIQAGSRGLTRAEVNTLKKQASAAVDKVPGMKLEKSLVKDHLDDLAKQGDHNALWEFRKSLDEQINYNSPNITPKVQQALKRIRATVDEKLHSDIPGLKALDADYSKGKGVQPFLQARVRKPGGVDLPVTTKFGGVSIGGEIGDAAKAAVGQVAEGTGRLTQAAKKIRHLKPLAAQAAVRVPGALTDAQTSPDGSELVSLDEGMADPGMTPADALAASEQPTGGLDIDAMLQEALSAPDAKTQAAKLELVDKLMDIEAKRGGTRKGGKLNSTAAGQIADANTAIRGLQELEASIRQSDAVGPVLGLRSKNPYDTEAKVLQAQIDRVRQIVGKALEGGVLRKEDEEKYKKILPTVRDTREVALQKLAYLNDAMRSRLSEYEGLVGATPEESLVEAAR